VTKVLGWTKTKKELRIVDDQISSPTWARMLAETTAQVIAQGRADPIGYLAEKSGLYHLAGGGYCSRLDWAQAILDLDPHKEEQQVREVQPAKTTDFPTPAVRPLFSVLECGKFTECFDLPLPDWGESLSLAMDVF
jgi:dTDP-4-dehydrorhamnose reductase